MKVEMIKWPSEADWMEVKKRALVTIGKEAVTAPSQTWKEDILMARHSPIRALQFSFYMELPSWVATHLARHIHAQPYIQSQRNDRQDQYDRNAARQDAPVKLVWDMNAEELLNIMNKRLCFQAAQETREVAVAMKRCVLEQCPEFKYVMVPMCMYHGGICPEMHSCGKVKAATAWRTWVGIGG